METVIEILIVVLLVAGGFFGLVGSFGLVKLPDAMSRLHAPTKATTLGVGSVLIASMAYSVHAEGFVSLHELIITLFLFLTAPITANFIAKTHLHRIVDPQTLPDAGTDECWAVYDVPEETEEKS